jgi:DNA-binding IclR family transcriptional regulator
MPKYSTPALEKGLDILEALAGAPRPLTLSELAGRLKRSPSELFRMADCLEKRGYAVRDPLSGSFSLTLKLYELAHTHSPVERLTRAAQAPLWDLSRETGESCHLSTLHGGHLLVLAQVESARPVRLSIEVGGKFPARQTASGRLLLAHLPPADRAAYLTALGARQRQALVRKLDEIRRAGASLAADETILGVHDAAVLAGNPEAGIIAAVAVSALSTAGARTNRAGACLPALRRCADRITRSIGLTP